MTPQIPSSNSIYSALLAILLGLLPGFSTANEHGDKDANDELAEMAVSKRAAAIGLAVMRSPTYLEAFSWGVFISKDGLALVDIQALVKQKKPTVVAVNDEKVKFGKILAVFPEQELALMKFDYRPKSWVPLAPVEPKLGETIALVTMMRSDPWNGEVSPVVGSVLVKRSGLTPNNRVARFTRTLSLGSGLTQVQNAALGPGCFALDRKGRLVGFMGGKKPVGSQILIEVTPVAALADTIDALVKEGKDIGHPLPAAHNSIDPAALDVDFHPMNLARARQDWKEAERLMVALQGRHPKSYALKIISRSMKLRSGPQHDLLLTFPEPDLRAPVAHQVSDWSARANVLAMRKEFDAAIEAHKKAIALSPEDYPEVRFSLARLYAHLGRIDEAEALFREAYPAYSDTIAWVEQFELLLSRQGNVKEARKLAKRVYELEKTYRKW